MPMTVRIQFITQNEDAIFTVVKSSIYVMLRTAQTAIILKITRKFYDLSNKNCVVLFLLANHTTKQRWHTSFLQLNKILD